MPAPTGITKSTQACRLGVGCSKEGEAALNRQIGGRARALMEPGLLKMSGHVAGQVESSRKVDEGHMSMRRHLCNTNTNKQLYGCTALTMEVKMHSRQTREEHTLPYILCHLPR